MSLARAAAAPREGFGLALAAVWVAVFSGFYVQEEPAPYDLLFVGVIGALTVAGFVRIPYGAAWPFLLFAAYTLSNLISIFGTFDWDRSLLYMAVTFYLMATTLFLMCFVLLDEDRVLATVWNAYATAAAVSSVLAIIGYFALAPGSEVLLLGNRARAFFKDPNVLGPFLVPAALALFARFESGISKRPWLDLAGLALITVGILLTFSRGAWANLLLAFGAYVGLRVLTASGRGLGRIMFTAFAAIAIGGGLVAYLVLFTTAGDVFADKATLIRYYDTRRFANQEEGLLIALSQPFGIGPGLSEQALDYAAHSLYIRLFLENGWFGALSFLGFVLAALVRGAAMMRRGLAHPLFLAAYAAIPGVLLNSFVIDSLHWRHFFLLLGLVWGSILAAEAFGRPRVQSGARRYDVRAV